jgi:hypothetical protein
MKSKIESGIEKIDWFQTSERERITFAQAFSNMELATLNQFRFESIRRARLFSLIFSSMTTLFLLLLKVDLTTIVIVNSIIQLVLFGMSQLFEMGSKKLVAMSEGAVLDLLKNYSIRYPIRSCDESKVDS